MGLYRDKLMPMKWIVLAMFLICFCPSFVRADIVSGLVGWWKFDEGSGTSAYDSSGSGNTGTLGNSPTWGGGKIGPYALSFNGANQSVTTSFVKTVIRSPAPPGSSHLLRNIRLFLAMMMGLIREVL